MLVSWYCVSTLLRLELQLSTECGWQTHAKKSKVKQRATRRWPHSRAWVVVVATLIFSFLRVASDKCWALFPLATEKSHCGGVKLMYTSHSQFSMLRLAISASCEHFFFFFFLKADTMLSPSCRGSLRAAKYLVHCREPQARRCCLRQWGKQLFADQANTKLFSR